MWEELWRALALVLIIEGIGPFVAPTRWRMTMIRMAHTNERTLRTIGLVSMLLGLVALRLLK